jgi:hypothetical protein
MLNDDNNNHLDLKFLFLDDRRNRWGGFLDDRWGGFLDDRGNRWGGFLDDSGGVFWMINLCIY